MIITTKIASYSLILCMALLFVQMADAQELTAPKPRQGYYVGIGIEGAMDGLFISDKGWIGPHVGPYGSLHVGQGILDNLAIGLHLGAGTVYSSERQNIIGNVSIEAKWSFFKDWFIRPSVGFGFVDITRRENGIEKVYSDIGGRYHLAVGYDFFPGYKCRKSGGWAVTPIVWASYSNATGLHSVNGGVGVEISFWTGLSKNQLILKGDDAYR